MNTEEAIRMLTRLKDQINFEWTDAQKKTDALNIAIEALQNEPRWIPCSERLPEKKGFYLVTTEERETATMGFYEDIWFKTEKVIAWMPLPKAYEGRTE